MTRPVSIPDINDYSPNHPVCLLDKKTIIGIYNFNSNDSKRRYDASEDVIQWVIDRLKVSGFKDVKKTSEASKQIIALAY